MSAPTSEPVPDLVWKFKGHPKLKLGHWHIPKCEACDDQALNVWRRVGVPNVNVYRCWNHGPGMDGRECDGPEQAKG